MRERDRCAAGRVGCAIRVPRDWLGWSGVMAPPGSPLGGGGPGNFRMIALLEENGGVVHDAQTRERLLRLAGGSMPTAPSVPALRRGETYTPFSSVQNEFVDIDLSVRVLADGSSGALPDNDASAVTQVTEVAAKAPGYAWSGKKKLIDSFDGKVVWRGVVTLQTIYKTGARREDVSCYGRGTTEDDVRARNITLGFHEDCHLRDYLEYMFRHPLPPPPKMKIGMPEQEYITERRQFLSAAAAYWRALRAHSEASTDQVGFTKKRHEDTKQCFVHALPPP
jgi:hypothetical protein